MAVTAATIAASILLEEMMKDDKGKEAIALLHGEGQNLKTNKRKSNNQRKKMGAGGSTIAAYSLFGVDHGAKKKKQQFLKMLGLKGKKARIFSDVTGYGYVKLNKKGKKTRNAVKKRKAKKISYI